MIVTNMAAACNEEKGLLGSVRPKSHRRYGSTSVNMKKPEHIIRHKVSKQDTLQGISLRYGVTMECVKQHNKLWSSEAMFLHDYLEVPVTKEVYDTFAGASSPCGTDTVNGRVSSPELRSESVSSGPSSVASSPLPQDPVPPASVSSPTFDYSDTLPKDFLSKIDTTIASMKSSIEKFDAKKYQTMDQMELEDNSRRASSGGRSFFRSAEHRRSLDANGGFPLKNGHFLNALNGRHNTSNGYVKDSTANGVTGSNTSNHSGKTNGSAKSNGARVNGGYVADPGDEMGRVMSPVSPPPVAVVGGNHGNHATQFTSSHFSSYHNQSSQQATPAPSTRSFTMSLKHLLREQDDFSPL